MSNHHCGSSSGEVLFGNGSDPIAYIPGPPGPRGPTGPAGPMGPAGVIRPAAAVPNATGSTVSAEAFNTLLENLRAAGLLAT